MLEAFDATDHRFFERLEATEPGAELATMLSRVDRDGVNGYHLVTVLAARARQIAHEQAEFYADMAEIAQCPPGDESSPAIRLDSPDYDEFVPCEISAALTLTRRAAQNQMAMALDLTERIPELYEALRRGQIDLYRARRILDATAHLDDDQARQVVDEIIDRAGEMTTGQLGARLRKIILTQFGEKQKEEYDYGLEHRAVTAYPNPDGTANLLATSLPGDKVAAIMRKLTNLAKAAHTPDDPRGIDQTRADVFSDLLLRSEADSYTDRSVVDIRVDLRTLLELSDAPGEIPGWGPVLADIARQIVAENQDGEWRFTITHPDTGAVLGDGTTRRRPTNRQKRWVEALRPTCVFPGCRMPARDSDIDHTKSRADGGHTVVKNLGPLCKYHHRLKHETPWDLRREDDTYIWTSPLGHTYTTNGQSP